MHLIQENFALSKQGAKDLCFGILWSLLAYMSLILPVSIFVLLLDEILMPVLSGQSIEVHLIKYLVLCIAALLVMFVFHLLQYGSVFISTYDESAKRRVTLAEKLRRLPISFFGHRDLSDLTGAIMSDCEGMEHAFSHAIPQLVGAILSTLIIAVGLFVMNWRLGLALLWVLPVAFAVIICSKRAQDRAGRKNLATKVAAADGIQECLETIREIKSYNLKNKYLEALDSKLDAAESAQTRSELTAAAFLATGQAFLRLGLVTVVLTGTGLLVSGRADMLSFFLFLMAATRIYDPVSGALANIAEVFNVKLKIERMKDIENQPILEGTAAHVTGGYDLRFHRVSFAYNENEPVLKNVSFTAKQGEVTALVGPSGSGKSTAAKLAARFWDVAAGKITLGDTDISTMDPEALLKDYAIVFQDVMLFNDTIMENIRLGRRDASEEEVIAASKAAKCDDFIRKLPAGYQTEVGENGSTLSGGERQRISIARAILKNAPVILLDEATASLDVESETQVQQAISHLIQGKTVLIIAHRMRTVAGADKIVVLDGGMVAQQGAPEELYRQGGLYRNMMELQKQSQEWTI